MKQVKVTRFATDVYLNMLRLSITVREDDCSCVGLELDFEYLRDFDPNNKPNAETLEKWILDCQVSSVVKFNEAFAVVLEPTAKPKEESKVAELKERRRKKAEVSVETPAPAVEAPVPTVEVQIPAPVETAPAVEVPAVTAPAVEAPAPKQDMVVYYDKKNREHALEVQKVLDMVDPKWKSVPACVEFAKQLVAHIHGKQMIFLNGKLSNSFTMLVESSYKAKDLGLWDCRPQP